eukprot:TRINITY_DN95077_c0_g1_i1.p1 TRINITY_DN95077_c0_g1~~TRINITY_DN95077_c0_g1_i1.p1  ORF type:complete len:281 (-),score=45.11 TRINITY_DN95077_c0_g1_i1:51-893(-)
MSHYEEQSDFEPDESELDDVADRSNQQAKKQQPQGDGEEIDPYNLGVSGFAIMFLLDDKSSGDDGLTGQACRGIALLVVVLQCAALELGVLYYMWGKMVCKEQDPEESPPRMFVLMCIYIHAIGLLTGLPMGIRKLTTWWRLSAGCCERMLPLFAGAVVILDEFALPAATLFFGGIYLARSPSTEDLILNALAVNFVVQIDDQIVTGLANWMPDVKATVRLAYLNDNVSVCVVAAFFSFCRSSLQLLPMAYGTLARIPVCTTWCVETLQTMCLSLCKIRI